MFEGFAANKELIEKISPAVESGRISHCVLISGERGTGRNLFARMLAAQIVAGENAQLRQKLLEAEHERIFTLDGENSKGKTNVITIEQVRGLKAQLSRMAFAGGARARRRAQGRPSEGSDGAIGAIAVFHLLSG